MRLREVSWAKLNERIDSREAPMFRLSWVADIDDPDSFLRAPFQSGGSTNYFGFADGPTDELLRQGEREMNPVTRAHIYREAEKRIVDLAPMVPLFHPVNALATQSHVRGVEPGPLGISVLDLEKVWFSAPEKVR